MCGIVGYLGRGDARSVLFAGLLKLEYRGYDSAGIALVDGEDIHIYKDNGRVSNLLSQVDSSFLSHCGIGHTRWATHGAPSKENAHPHVSNNGRFILVHNGVIENVEELKDGYLSGYTYASETDSEVIANLLEEFAKDSPNVLAAIRRVMDVLEGSYALLILDKEEIGSIYFANNKTPLVIGESMDGISFASDALSLVGCCESYAPLGDFMYGRADSLVTKVYGRDGEEIKLTYRPVTISSADIELGEYSHYMRKEIAENPLVVRRLLARYLSGGHLNMDPKLLEALSHADKINLVACGTSRHASYMAKYFFEKFAGIPSEVFCASELVYSQPLIKDHPFFIYLSQSGETADVIACVKRFQERGYPSLSLTNVDTSTLASLADYHLSLCAGPEIAVASTKAYVAEVILTCILAKALQGNVTEIVSALRKVLDAMESVFSKEDVIIDIASSIKDSPYAFFIGRGIDYWSCKECSLKLKEVSYIHSEAFPSGELKHGTIALMERGTPVLALITQEGTSAATRSNVIEVESRGAISYVLSTESLARSSDVLVIPDVANYLSPLLSVVVGQLLAYHVARLKGNDVDKPKNLAKSVTVE